MTIRKPLFVVARRVLRAVRPQPSRAVFILGHMRCGSTLLLHILLTHPGIAACGERNAPYRSADDLDRLEIFARLSGRALFRPISFAADQINHDHVTPIQELLRSDRVRCIFLLREPEDTLRSILHLTRTFYEPWSYQRAVDYYCRRLESLAGYAGDAGIRKEALTYNDLVMETPRVLRRLESFLNLDRPLREDYTIQPFTGQRGDPGSNIRLGRIVRNRVVEAVELPEKELRCARAAYENCIRALRLG